MLVKLVFYALMAGREEKKWINFYKQGVKNLRFEQRHFNCLERWLFLESQFVWERDWLGENKKKSLFDAFLRKLSDFSLKQKQWRNTLHVTLYFTIDFTG